MRKTSIHLFVGLLMLLLQTDFIFAQSTISGKITNENGTLLPGASIQIVGTNAGALSDANGAYSIKTNQNPPFKVRVSFVGYLPQTIDVISNNSVQNIVLMEDSALSEEIVISTSRKPEKIQESPSAISVIGSEKLRADNVANPFLSLRSVTGVDVAQTGVSQGQVTLRGRNAAFNTETFVIADYRNIVLPSFGVMLYGQNPIDAVDLDRIEVIKGASGALYGPGVEAGVVHFISKSPFKEKGTSVSLGGGNRSQMHGAFRHAGIGANQKFGYKITGYYRKANDFEADMTDPVQAARINFYPKEIKSSLTGAKIKDGGLDYDNQAYNINGMIEYRIARAHSIIGVVGTGNSQSLFKSGQSDGYINVNRPYAQIRYQNKGFFAQSFWSHHIGTDGTAWVYATGSTQVNDIQQYEGQAQYNFQAAKNKLNITLGGDVRLNTIDTKSTVNGRFEADDDYLIAGSYIQTKLALGKKLDLVGAIRYDYFGALEETGVSPRLALVIKSTPNQTFRVTWNKAIGAPTSLQLVNDFATVNRGAFVAWLSAGSQPMTFTQNRYYSFVTQKTQTTPDLPMVAAFGAATAGLQAEGAALPFTLLNSDAFKARITGTLKGSLIDANGNPYAPLSRDVIGISSSNMFEVGYQGKLDKLSMTLDAYHNIRKNNLTTGMTASPLIGYANAGVDLKKVVYDALIASNIPVANATAISNAYETAINTNTKTKTGALAPLGLWSSDQSPTGKTLDATYFNIEKIKYSGIDLGLNYSANNKLLIFGNVSYLSQVYWEKVKVTGSNTFVPFSLNQPAQRVRIGFDYLRPKGIMFNALVRYQSAFTSVNGSAWSGPIHAFTIVDAGVGYTFSPKLGINVTGTNLLNEKYRVLANAPFITRLVLAKLSIQI